MRQLKTIDLDQNVSGFMQYKDDIILSVMSCGTPAGFRLLSNKNKL